MQWKAEDLTGKSIGNGKCAEALCTVGVGRLSMRWDRVVQISGDSELSEGSSELIAT